MSQKIVLSQNKHTIVDDEDYEYLNQWKWSAKYDKAGYFYAMRKDEKRKSINMARLIMNPPKGKLIHHINHNTLDNRKQNLQIVTHRQNLQSLKVKKTSKFPGVYWDKKGNKWKANISINNKMVYLGSFTDEREAAKCYESAVRKLGEELVCKAREE